MIIHARQVKVKEKVKILHNDDLVSPAERFKDGLRNPKSGAKAFTENNNPFGFCVRATNNGSMTQDSFMTGVFISSTTYLRNRKKMEKILGRTC